jgi:hypothetical protein
MVEEDLDAQDAYDMFIRVASLLIGKLLAIISDQLKYEKC